jgi:hypothetical protein
MWMPPEHPFRSDGFLLGVRLTPIRPFSRGIVPAAPAALRPTGSIAPALRDNPVVELGHVRALAPAMYWHRRNGRYDVNPNLGPIHCITATSD